MSPQHMTLQIDIRDIDKAHIPRLEALQGHIEHQLGVLLDQRDLKLVVVVIEDAVLHATNTVWTNFTDGTKHLKGDTDPVTIPAGITIYGQFTAVGLDSGSVLCYHAV